MTQSLTIFVWYFSQSLYFYNIHDSISGVNISIQLSSLSRMLFTGWIFIDKKNEGKKMHRKQRRKRECKDLWMLRNDRKIKLQNDNNEIYGKKKMIVTLCLMFSFSMLVALLKKHRMFNEVYFYPYMLLCSTMHWRQEEKKSKRKTENSMPTIFIRQMYWTFYYLLGAHILSHSKLEHIIHCSVFTELKTINIMHFIFRFIGNNARICFNKMWIFGFKTNLTLGTQCLNVWCDSVANSNSIQWLS